MWTRERVRGAADTLLAVRVAAGATGYHPLSDPEPPRAAPEPHEAPNGSNLAARLRAPVSARDGHMHGTHYLGTGAKRATGAAPTRVPHAPGPSTSAHVLGGGGGGLPAACGASNGHQRP